MKQLRLFLLCAALLFLTNGASIASPRGLSRGENFEPVECTTFKINGDEFECGYVTVPEIHAQPNGRKIKLGVAILPATSTDTPNDAFVMAQGGPGGSTIDTFAPFFQLGYYPALETLRRERDIVLYDQRGTLYSQPALMCPEELQLTFDTLEKELSPDEELRLAEQASLQCRDRLLKEGVDLAAYNSIENALDIEDLRRALGYDRFDFYGVSYGTLLALHGLRATPGTFRSVILDAVVPTQLNPNVDVAQSQDHAFERLFSACAADADCNRAYPNLKQVFYGVVDSLNKSSARVQLTDSKSDKTYNAVMDGNLFMEIMFQFIYNSELVPVLPQMIYDAHNGVYTLIETYYPLVAFDRTFASGMYYAVMCAEDADFEPGDLALDGVDPHIAASQKRDTAAFLELCRKWNVPQLGTRADEPVTATVPTLVLSGDFDPITPPPFGQAAAKYITPSFAFDFPAYGHGAATSGNCANEMIAAFVRDPERAPNAQCIAREASHVSFVTPSTQILSRGIGKLQYAMLQAKIETFLIPIFCVAFLLSIWTIGPLAWLIRRSQKRQSEPQLLARLAPWIVGLASLMAAAFFVIVFVLVLVASLRNENSIDLLLGAPLAWSPVYWLPLLFTVCALLFTVATAFGWQRRNWENWRRVYFTLLAIAALALVVWFAANGVLLPILN